MKRVLIEGWRGINTSFAMVNQYQLLELLKRNRFELAHKDMDFCFPSWNMQENSPGFPVEDQRSIDSIPPPDAHPYDVVYNICYPIGRSSAVAGKAITFMITEFGLHSQDFAEEDRDLEFFTQDENCIVVPSNWAKTRLEDYGFPANKLHLVPLGVDGRVFCPLQEAARLEARNELGLKENHFAFLNLGAMTHNKGVDVLLRAFARVRKEHSNARLVLKDSRQLYGITTQNLIQRLISSEPGVITEEVRSSIILVVAPTLPLSQMNRLYCAADAYVSPYRAEGFNLPVIEAIASGTPAIVTSGGPTDDFCNSSVALMVQTDFVENKKLAVRETGHHLEPRLESLTEQMTAALQGKGIPQGTFAKGRKLLIDKYSWKASVNKLSKLF